MIILISSVKDVISKLPLGNKKRLALIPNADLDNKIKIKRYSLFLKKNGFNLSIVDLTKFKDDELYKKLLQFEIIFVVGGNTFVLLQKIRESGFDNILSKLLDNGIIYVGESAGACVMGTSIEPIHSIDKPENANLTNYNGLGYADFVFIPHSTNLRYIEKIVLIKRKYSKKFKLRTFSDTQGIIIENGVVRDI